MVSRRSRIVLSRLARLHTSITHSSMMPETRATLRYAAIIAVVFGIIWMVSF
jgi:hypothetical protein